MQKLMSFKAMIIMGAIIWLFGEFILIFHNSPIMMEWFGWRSLSTSANHVIILVTGIVFSFFGMFLPLIMAWSFENQYERLADEYERLEDRYNETNEVTRKLRLWVRHND